MEQYIQLLWNKYPMKYIIEIINATIVRSPLIIYMKTSTHVDTDDWRYTWLYWIEYVDRKKQMLHNGTHYSILWIKQASKPLRHTTRIYWLRNRFAETPKHVWRLLLRLTQTNEVLCGPTAHINPISDPCGVEEYTMFPVADEITRTLLSTWCNHKMQYKCNNIECQ